MGRIGEGEYARLMTEHRHRFYRIAYSYVKNEQDALDIVSEATYKGLKQIKTLRESDFFVTWMTRIIIHTALDDQKKRTRLVFLEEEQMEQERGGTPPLEEEIHFDLYDAMDILHPEEKTCIILKYFEGYAFRDIAKMLQTPESTVKSRVYSSLKKMKTYMEGGKRT